MAYVSISRGRWDAQIFTDSREKLPQALGHDVSHQSAYKPEQAIAHLSRNRATATARQGIEYGVRVESPNASGGEIRVQRGGYLREDSLERVRESA